MVAIPWQHGLNPQILVEKNSSSVRQAKASTMALEMVDIYIAHTGVLIGTPQQT